MLSASDHLERIEAQLASVTNAVVVESQTFVTPDDLLAEMQLTLGYLKQYRLHVTLTVDTTYGYPAWMIYAFHFQDADDRTIFRYDNWPHHPGLPTFPHHKHVGGDEVVEAHAQPSVATIVREIAQHIDDESGPRLTGTTGPYGR